ncbi:protein rolling stone [Lutzomyia longipalpis]|uniref:protein rolling stone n=1 Tax=Lutzomyia longipalpis TaxID=7200 RepID=UPI00248421F5|nr:protein rolling stone [Lutzomyia longipalpis]
MMVTKIWNSCFPDTDPAQEPDQVHRHNFYLCQWQTSKQVKIIYLLYRWLAAILFLAVLSCSLLDIGRSDTEHYEHHYAKWWIYLTHWALLACTLQAWLAAWIVTQGMMVDRDDFEIQRLAKTRITHRMYWVLYTIATVYSFIVTICYWTIVHDPEINKLDAVNLMVHVLNSVLMLIDLAIVGQPIRLSHAYWTTGIGVIYAIFTGIYFLAGGTNRRNLESIYPLLDWRRPGKAIVISACGILFVFIVHLAVFCLYRLRVCLYTKVCIWSRNRRMKKMSSLGRTLSSLEDAQKENFLGPSTIIDVKM